METAKAGESGDPGVIPLHPNTLPNNIEVSNADKTVFFMFQV